MNKGIVSLIAVAVSVSGSWSAATAGDSLKDALIAAYHSNPDLQRQRTILKGTDELLPQANANFLPRAQATGSFGHSTLIGPRYEVDANGNVGQTRSKGYSTRAGVSVSQPLFDGLGDVAGRKAAKSLVRAGRAQLRNVEQIVFSDVVAAYLNVIRDTSILELQKNNEQLLERQLEASRARFQVGEITQTDVAQSQARLQRALTSVLEASAQLEASKSFYLRVVGLQAVGLDVDQAMPDLPTTLDDAMMTARERSPVIESARYNEQAAKYSVRQRVADLLPSVGLSASLDWNNPENRWSVVSDGIDPSDPSRGLNNDSTTKSYGISVTVPLYQGGGEYSRIRAAKLTRSQRMIEIHKAEREVQEVVTTAWQNYKAAEASILSTQAQADANQIALDGVRQEAAVGSRTTLEVLNAAQELLSSQVDLVRSQRNALVAAYGLLAATGQLTAGDLSLETDLYDPEVHYKKVRNKVIGTGIQ